MTETSKPLDGTLDERTLLKVLMLSKHFPIRMSKRPRKVIEAFNEMVEIVKKLDEVG